MLIYAAIAIAIASVCMSARHTSAPRLNGLNYRNMVYDALTLDNCCGTECDVVVP